MCKCGSGRIASMNAKCSDCCSIDLPHGETLNGYVPKNLNIGGGDYIKFRFCMDCGRIQGEFPLEGYEGDKEIDCPCSECGCCVCGNEHCSHWEDGYCEC